MPISSIFATVANLAQGVVLGNFDFDGNPEWLKKKEADKDIEGLRGQKIQFYICTKIQIIYRQQFMMTEQCTELQNIQGR